MEASKKIKPYVSKRKRNAEREDYEKKRQKPTDIQPNDVKSLFITEETVLQNTNSNHNFPPRSVLKSVPVISSPLWAVKWCPRFSHLIACTAETSLRLYDVMKQDVPCCVYASEHHTEFVRDLDWSRTSRQIATCSFDRTVQICDFLSGGKITQSIVLTTIPNVVRWLPDDDNTVIVGGHNSFLASYDLRSGKQVTTYKSMCGNVIAIDFFKNQAWFVAAGDAVSRQSPEHGLIVWDSATGAKLSNQIFHERYSCPSVRVHPSGSSFLAQTNGNYIARFKAQRPFSLDKCIRYEQHHVEGYPVGFDLSPDGTVVASGSSDGTVVCYKYANSNLLRKIPLSHKKVPANSVISVQWHPVIPSMLAASDWSGNLHVLR